MTVTTKPSGSSMTDAQSTAETKEVIKRLLGGHMASAAAAASPSDIGGVSSGATTSTKDTSGTKKSDPPGGGTLPPSGNDGQGDGWWARLSTGNQIFLLIMLAIVVTFSLHAWSDYWNQRSAIADAQVSDVKNRADIEKAKAELEVAKLKAEAASYQAKKSVKTPALVVDVSTFGCSTIERLYNGFANAPTVDGAQGTQLMVTDGCANIRFDHEITSLEGIGYAVTFDPVNSPNPQRCGNGAQGKDDAPSTCLAYINSNIGRTLHVLVNKNSFVKLGG